MDGCAKGAITGDGFGLLVRFAAQKLHPTGMFWGGLFLGGLIKIRLNRSGCGSNSAGLLDNLGWF